jgi:uncharacterized protein YnzC (UPF0291/DUF896 family)
MNFTRRTTSVVAIAAVAGLGLAACDNGPKPVKDQPGSSSQAKGKSTTPVKLTSADFSKRMADAQAKAGSVHMEMKVTAAGMSIPIDADVVLPEGNDPDKVKMKMSMDMSSIAGSSSSGLSGNMEILMLGTKDIYMKMGSMTQNKWAKLSSSQLSQMNLDQSMSGSDPAAQAALMKKYLKEFKENGSETIDGVETTRYDVTVDTKMLTEQAEKQGTSNAGSAADMIGDTLTYNIWIGDKDDLPRKMAFEMGSAGSTEMTFTKWGDDVDISAPPADQITDSLPSGF